MSLKRNTILLFLDKKNHRYRSPLNEATGCWTRARFRPVPPTIHPAAHKIVVRTRLCFRSTPEADRRGSLCLRSSILWQLVTRCGSGTHFKQFVRGLFGRSL